MKIFIRQGLFLRWSWLECCSTLNIQQVNVARVQFHFKYSTSEFS